MSRKGVLGLTSQIKDKLIQQALERRLRNAEDATGTRFTGRTTLSPRESSFTYSQTGCFLRSATVSDSTGLIVVLMEI